MTFRELLLLFGASPLIQMATDKFQISRDSQALYTTVVAKDRLPVFQSDAIKIVSCKALDEARESGQLVECKDLATVL